MIFLGLGVGGWAGSMHHYAKRVLISIVEALAAYSDSHGTSACPSQKDNSHIIVPTTDEKPSQHSLHENSKYNVPSGEKT